MTDDENTNEAAPITKAAEKTAADMVGQAAKPDPKAKDAPKDEPAKLTLTEAEMQQRIDTAIKAREDAAAEQAKKDKAAADAKAAEEKGEWKTLHESEKAARETAERDLATAKLAAKGKDVDLAIRDHLADKHPEYVAVAKYVRPLVAFDAGTTDETLAKRVADAASQYVKDNPRAKSAPAGAPAGADNGVRRPYTEPVNRNGTPRITGAAAQF